MEELDGLLSDEVGYRQTSVSIFPMKETRPNRYIYIQMTKANRKVTGRLSFKKLRCDRNPWEPGKTWLAARVQTCG